jgi:hypothetical protein
MRTNLIVDFKEKDKVKALGAQWDSARKVWYIEDVENIEQFLPWIPNNLKKPSGLIDSKKKFVKWKKTFGVVDVKLKDIK